MSTPWRTGLYEEISNLSINGKIIDLGGSKKSGYHELIKGENKIEVVNIDDKYGFDHKFDLEGKFDLSSHHYDAVLAINALEHVYNYNSFISESKRVLKEGGMIVIGVPFLIQYHPCPNDFWRYTKPTLKRILEDNGFKHIEIKTIGAGPFTATAQILNNVLKFSFIRKIYSVINVLDMILWIFMGKNRMVEDYPLGYFVIAKK